MLSTAPAPGATEAVSMWMCGPDEQPELPLWARSCALIDVAAVGDARGEVVDVQVVDEEVFGVRPPGRRSRS